MQCSCVALRSDVIAAEDKKRTFSSVIACPKPKPIDCKSDACAKLTVYTSSKPCDISTSVYLSQPHGIESACFSTTCRSNLQPLASNEEHLA